MTADGLGRRSFRRIVRDKRLAVALPVAAAVAVLLLLLLRGTSSTSTFCGATGHGATAQAAIGSYLRRCGSDYTIAGGPHDGDKATTPYASYSNLVEYVLAVKNNLEGDTAFEEVGQRVAGGSWQTLGLPGTGP